MHIHICIHMCVHMLSHFSHIQLFATPWTVAHQAPLSMGISGQEYWSDLPFSSPGDLLNPGIKPTSLTCFAVTDGYFQFSSVQSLNSVQLFMTPWADRYFTTSIYLPLYVCVCVCVCVYIYL